MNESNFTTTLNSTTNREYMNSDRKSYFTFAENDLYHAKSCQ